MSIGDIGFRPRTVIEAIDHVRCFRGCDLKSIAEEIQIKPKSGKFKGMDITQWEKLNLWQLAVEKETKLWHEGGREATGKRNPPNLASKTKNWAADIAEGMFGYKANSSRKKDLGFLELKTFGAIEREGKWLLKERFLPLTSFNWQEVNNEPFNHSKIRQKIMQQLWIPIIKNDAGLGSNATVDAMGEFRIGPPIIWIPTEDEASSMAEDYERVRREVKKGRHGRVSARVFSSKNEFIVPNTAGTNKFDKTSYISESGELHSDVKRRKWNLKRGVVRDVFLLHVESD